VRAGEGSGTSLARRKNTRSGLGRVGNSRCVQAAWVDLA
jgi:hypothetical protein